ncbi:hypothetical protein RKD52_000742 [Metabacillus sp. SLBN-84]
MVVHPVSGNAFTSYFTENSNLLHVIIRILLTIFGKL